MPTGARRYRKKPEPFHMDVAREDERLQPVLTDRRFTELLKQAQRASTAVLTQPWLVQDQLEAERSAWIELSDYLQTRQWPRVAEPKERRRRRRGS